MVARVGGGVRESEIANGKEEQGIRVSPIYMDAEDLQALDGPPCFGRAGSGRPVC